VKDENNDLLTDTRNNSNRWKNYFSQLLNVHNISDVRQIEVCATEFVIRKNCMISARSLLLHQFRERGIKLNVIIIVRYHCYQFHR
jgi:hypothetical protein